MNKIACLLLLITVQHAPAQGAKNDVPTACFAGQQQGPKIYTFVEQMPQFPGGDSAMMRFIAKTLEWPVESDIQGKVLMRFVVNEDGSISDAVVIRGISPGVDAEALRVVKLLPKFVPGKQQGKAVKVYYNLPIVFKLN